MPLVAFHKHSPSPKTRQILETTQATTQATTQTTRGAMNDVVVDQKIRSRWNTPLPSFSTTPTSVIIPSTSAAGVTSNAGFHTPIPSAATVIVSIAPSPFPFPSSPTRGPRILVTSFSGRSSITISAPVFVFISMVVRGAATRNLTPWYFASTARPYVPILLAVSPLAATRSAPTIMALTPTL
ncbi:hypothetical protein I7I53_11557 [Histoplasma capsulatum var. duboisii H88]|uniref:Uncharacterized protein n=1 Tax=Ajellomyces capsulatus (strain H88) TaxID=544711 RepID=A0A8A1LT44_AJEC8|nr:hypothetical protein I7I53_11557 [Histoplasma capsulatum var. duboisii H88]